jgi:molecular chaperone DnaK (HSP70)
VLMELRDAAEASLGQEVTKCVITVPAYFTAEQKRATRDAGEIAGLDVLAIIAEPTAAALAYGLDEKTTEGENFRRKVEVDGWHVLVFDLGGGTLDVCVLRMDGRGGFAQRAVTGDSHLGGEDFDTRLADAVEGRLAAEFPNNKLSYKSRRRLRTECERVKRMLSSATETTLELDLQGIDISYDVSRADFEGACHDLFERALAVTLEAVQLARLRPQDIDEVVLVGGSTRIPMIRRMLADAFRDRPQWNGINPDEAVALGAATYAATQYLASLDDGAVDIDDSAFESVPPTPSIGSQPQPPPQVLASTARPPAATPAPIPPTKIVVMPPGAKGPMMPFPGVVPSKVVVVAGGNANMPGVPHAHPAVPPAAPSGPPPPDAVSATNTPSSQQGAQPNRPALPNVKVPASRPPAGVVPPKGPPKQAPAVPTKPSQPTAAAVVLSNVATHTLGIMLAGGEVDPLVPRGTPLPVSITERYTTQKDKQTAVTIRVVEGDDRTAAKNRTLKKFVFEVPPAPAGDPQVLVTFALSADGLLSVTAKDEKTGKKQRVTVDGAGTMEEGQRQATKEKMAAHTRSKKTKDNKATSTSGRKPGEL